MSLDPGTFAARRNDWPSWWRTVGTNAGTRRSCNGFSVYGSRTKS